jgi:hypothetical protein
LEEKMWKAQVKSELGLIVETQTDKDQAIDNHLADLRNYDGVMGVDKSKKKNKTEEDEIEKNKIERDIAVC